MSDVERTEFQLPNDAARPEPLQRNENIAAEMQLGEHDVERSLRPKGLMNSSASRRSKNSCR